MVSPEGEGIAHQPDSHDTTVVPARLVSGGWITKPRAEMHAMWNAGPVPARMIEVISPAGFENFFRELAELLESDTPELAEIPALGVRYGLQFGQPEWLPDVISRYGLTP